MCKCTFVWTKHFIAKNILVLAGGNNLGKLVKYQSQICIWLSIRKQNLIKSILLFVLSTTVDKSEKNEVENLPAFLLSQDDDA